jgi:hypothetical protein
VLLPLGRPRLPGLDPFRRGLRARQDELELRRTDYFPAAEFLVLAIGGGTVNTLDRWNDHPARKHEDVMAALDRAIELADQAIASLA